ncbi:sushi domain-containing protein 1 [Elgaria multicarinata webbii]|uniref:sushi domain-containing protein 1 n=1 Tax=Elgaria multicarinata webbii TaxID=159646 RepID=UPI002FCCD00A
MSPGGTGEAPSPARQPHRRRPPSPFPPPLLFFLALVLFSRSSSEQEKEPDATSNLLSDVCASCHANATCQKQDGKDICICNYGFVGNGRTFCQDKDECQFGTSKICGDHTSCHNTYGSFYCICFEGFQASSKNKIFIPNDGTNCRDIDECEVSDICGLGGRCVNTAGSYECYCVEGYQLENGTEPFHSVTEKISCKVVDCGPPPSLPNAYLVLGSKTTYGTKVVYTCQPNYVIESGNWTAACNSRGQWEGADVVCKEIDCGKPLWFPNTDVIWDNTTTLGSIIYYKCKDGFQFFGERNFSQCTTSQKWENIKFECKEISCGQPPLILHSDIKWNGTSHLGSVVEYKCKNNSYPTSTKLHSFCTKNGSWEILDLRCETHLDAIKVSENLAPAQPAVESLPATTSSAVLHQTQAASTSAVPLQDPEMQDFLNPAMNNSCLTWRRRYRNPGANKTYRLTTMRMLGNEPIKIADVLINPPATEEAVNVCLSLHQDANYTVEITAESVNLVLKVKITRPVVEKEVAFKNISIFNDTCIKWQRASGRTQAEETYVFHIQGLRWYQKEFCYTITPNFTTVSQIPEVCFTLPPGSNYTVNISTANLDHSVLVYMTTPITDPQSPEVKFVTVYGSSPLFSLRKAEEKNGPISSYQVIAAPWRPQCSFNCYSLTSLAYFSKGSDSEGYVAAEFPAQVIADNMLDFTLGDRRYYGKFYNAPLKKGKDYCIILKTISEWNGVRKQSCVVWAHIKDSSSPPQHLTFVLLGSGAALCSILLLLLCVACAAVHMALPSVEPTRRTAGLLSATIYIAKLFLLLFPAVMGPPLLADLIKEEQSLPG